jgi:hypothetical protein
MDYHGDIVSGRSIGGIHLGADIDTVLADLRTRQISFSDQFFSNFNRTYRKLGIHPHSLDVVADDTGLIVRLWCRTGYSGTYKGAFFPGMCVDEICALSTKQLVIHGMLILDGDFGAGFSIPERYKDGLYDDVDSVKELPGAMVLDELHVMHPEWWR